MLDSLDPFCFFFRQGGAETRIPPRASPPEEGPPCLRRCHSHVIRWRARGPRPFFCSALLSVLVITRPALFPTQPRQPLQLAAAVCCAPAP